MYLLFLLPIMGRLPVYRIFFDDFQCDSHQIPTWDEKVTVT
jgi:hypothetical protein